MPPSINIPGVNLNLTPDPKQSGPSGPLCGRIANN
jgi:hypothetical protein